MREADTGFNRCVLEFTMQEVSLFRLYLLRAMYLLIGVGLGISLWPSIIASSGVTADANSVVRALLGALSLLCVLGLRYPLRMLPLLIFELLWKLIWVVVFALPLWVTDSLDAYGQETLFACMIGVVLVPLVLPWGYIYRTYVVAPTEAWTREAANPNLRRLRSDVSREESITASTRHR